MLLICAFCGEEFQGVDEAERVTSEPEREDEFALCSLACLEAWRCELEPDIKADILPGFGWRQWEIDT